MLGFGDTIWNLPPKSAILFMPSIPESDSSPEITFVLGVYTKKRHKSSWKIGPKNWMMCVFQQPRYWACSDFVKFITIGWLIYQEITFSESLCVSEDKKQQHIV